MNFNCFKGIDNIQKFSVAMTWLRDNPDSELVIPKGIYEITSGKEKKFFYDVIAGKYGDNPQPHTFRRDLEYTRVLDFYGQRGSRIIADGVTLVLDGFFEPVSLCNCKDIEIIGLTVDYRRKPYSHGYIERAETDERGNGEITVRFTEEMPDTFNHPRLAVYDGKTGVFGYDAFGIVGQKRISGNTFRLQITGAKKDYNGFEIYIWHFFHSRPAVCIQNSENIRLKNMTIHAHHGMGIVGHLSRDIFIEGLSVIPSAGERMSTNTDATHFASCYGRLIMRGCAFEGHGDDAVNVHNYYHAITPLGERKYRLRCLEPDGTHTLATDVPAVNDTMQLTKRGTLDRAGEYTVIEACENGDGTCNILLSEKLPSDTENYYLENLSACPEFVFSHCRVRNHRARSVLIKTKRALVNNCVFEHSDLAAVVVSAEEAWGEGTSAEHIEITDNVFIGCSMCGYRASAVDVFTNSEKGTGEQHGEIIIKNNTVVGCGGLVGISVKNTKKSIIENNIERK